MFDKFLEFKAYVEKQFTTSLQILRTDGDTEYINNKMYQYLVSHGIIHQYICPYTPSQNGAAERKHKHITETVIALLHHSGVPLKYWFDAIANATFLVNRMPSLTLNHLNPFEVLFHQSPDHSSFKFFGCQCFP